MEKFALPWENLQCRRKICIAVGKFAMPWENLQCRGKKNSCFIVFPELANSSLIINWSQISLPFFFRSSIQSNQIYQIRLDQIRLSQIRVEQIRVDQIKLDHVSQIYQIRLNQIKLDQIRLIRQIDRQIDRQTDVDFSPFLLPLLNTVQLGQIDRQTD